MQLPFRKMTKAYDTTSCVISVDQKEPIGRLYPRAKEFAVMLFVNPGPDYAPSISLSFKIEGKIQSCLEWDTEGLWKRRFAINHFEYHQCDLNVTNPRLSDPGVLDQCELHKLGELLYMRFDSWPQGAGFSSKGAFKKQSPSVVKAMQTLCQPLDSYSLEIWFIAPFNARVFRKGCLRYFDDSLRKRHSNLDQWQDPDGISYIDRPKPPTYTTPSEKRILKALFRLPSVPKSHDVGEAQDVEDTAPMSAQDAGKADPSTSPRPEEQTMLKSGAGPSSHPMSQCEHSRCQKANYYEHPV